MKKRKKNKYIVNPEAVLDLHGFTKKEAQEELFNFLREARQKNYQKIKIITGQGWHNPDFQSVLKPHIENILDNQGYEYQNAKMNDGGGGALIVKI
jgi:DNA-nicking Smr family endonuclease